ncbi:MAG: glutamate racemase [Vulcanimicrobiaceae bacterium]
MLGVFDSGLGGLTVVRQLQRRLPKHDILYLADQAHVPYGDRSPEDLQQYLHENIGYLNERSATPIVVACNTSCAVAMERGWPQSDAPILNLIQNAAEAVAALGARRIGVIATTVTAKSGAYGRALRERIHGAHVDEVPAPALVPLVEAGRYNGRAVRAAVEEACAPFPRDLEVVIYGCTHYPILDAHFAAVLGPEVVRLDPAIAQADATVRFVEDNRIAGASGATHYVTTGDRLAFTASVRALLGEEDPVVIAGRESAIST